MCNFFLGLLTLNPYINNDLEIILAILILKKNWKIIQTPRSILPSIISSPFISLSSWIIFRLCNLKISRVYSFPVFTSPFLLRWVVIVKSTFLHFYFLLWARLQRLSKLFANVVKSSVQSTTIIARCSLNYTIIFNFLGVLLLLCLFHVYLNHIRNVKSFFFSFQCQCKECWIKSCLWINLPWHWSCCIRKAYGVVLLFLLLFL